MGPLDKQKPKVSIPQKCGTWVPACQEGPFPLSAPTANCSYLCQWGIEFPINKYLSPKLFQLAPSAPPQPAFLKLARLSLPFASLSVP